MLDAPPKIAPPPEAPERTELPYGRRVYLPVAGEGPVSDPYGEPDFPDYKGSDTAYLVNLVMVRPAGAPQGIACDAGNLALRRGETVLLDFEQGAEIAVVTAAPRRQMVEGRAPVRVMRRAMEADLRAETRARLREAEVLRTAVDIAHRIGLPAKVTRAETSLQGGRTVVYLASEDRLDYRELARQLSAVLRGRVEIRSIGVRDAAKQIGGVGPCGLQLCCNTFLADFAPVSIRQAKDQGLALNPQRVSGVCGRLMCCLMYEDAFYRQQRALFPKQGKRVMTPKGEGRVREVDVLARTVRVFFPDGTSEGFSVDEVQSVTAQNTPGRTAAPTPEDEGEGEAQAD